MLAIPMAVARSYLLSSLQSFWNHIRRPTDSRLGLEDCLLGSLILIYLALALLPELAHDALAMHLFAPAYVAANKAWNFDPDLYVWTYMPLLANWAYTIAYVIAGETAARLINFAFLMITTAIVRQFVIYFGGSRRGANWAILVLLSTPLALLLGSSLFSEAFWSAYLLTGLLWITKAVRECDGDLKGLLHGGTAVGFAAAAKAVVLPHLPLLALPVISRLAVTRSRKFWLWSVVGALAFLAIAAWPYLLAYVETGNPVFPFFNSFFQSPLFPEQNFNNVNFNAELTWTLPYQLVFSTGQFIEGRVGGAGFQWLTLAAPAVAVLLLYPVRQIGVVIAFTILSLVLIFQFQTYLRYIFPAFMLMSVLIGVAISRCAERFRILHLSILAVAWLTVTLNLLFLGAASWRYSEVPVLDLFRHHGTEALIQRKAPIRRAVEVLNVVNELDYPVAFLAGPEAAGLKSNALHSVWHNQKFRSALTNVGNLESFGTLLRRNRARYLIHDPRKKGMGPPIQEYVSASGEAIATFGSISVYRVRDDVYFVEEMLRGPKRLGVPPWHAAEGVERLGDGTVIVAAEATVIQDVRVREGDSYLLTVTARCGDLPSRGRVQVNWHDLQSSFLKADIRVFECRQNWSNESAEVRAPADATIARVYGTSHGKTPIVLSEISFRGVNYAAPQLIPIRWFSLGPTGSYCDWAIGFTRLCSGKRCTWKREIQMSSLRMRQSPVTQAVCRTIRALGTSTRRIRQGLAVRSHR